MVGHKIESDTKKVELKKGPDTRKSGRKKCRTQKKVEAYCESGEGTAWRMIWTLFYPAPAII